MNDNVKTVRAIYEAFGKGDVRSIQERMSGDVRWEYAWKDSPVPWLRPGTGRDHVAAFFGVLASELELKKFAVTHVLGNERVVVALVDIEGVVRSTGKKIVEIDEPHVWHFDESGKVIRFRHAADTWQQAMAFQR